MAETSMSIRRRDLMRGAVWSVPVVAAATTLPRTAASDELLCNSNEVPFEGQCVCAPGYSRQDGICLPTSLVCSPGEVYIDGVCEPEIPCPAGVVVLAGIQHCL